jgi:5-methylthioadenosine/S-adenosylhomocysteine deaminase
LEALKGGTTCVSDLYRFIHRCAAAAGDLGIRACLAPYVADHPTKNFFENLNTTEKLIKTHHQTQNGRIQIFVGLEHLFYCSEEAYLRARHLSDHYDVMIHTHSSELKDEVDAVVQHFGDLPLNILQQRQILTPKTIIAHCVWLTDDELKLMADKGVGIAHCPTSNAKLGGGVIRFEEIRKLNIKMGLGSDGGISNNSLSQWESMKFASLIQKATKCNPEILPASEVLRMATIEGAKLLGLDKDIGSLEVGKKADIITVDLWQPHLMPIAPSSDHDPVIWNLVFAGRASDVRDVWIDGQQVLQNGYSTLMNETDVLVKTHAQTISLLKRREATQVVKMIS